MTQHDETPQTTDNITIRVYDAADAPTAAAAAAATPRREYRTHNATRAAYHEEVIAGLAGDAGPDIEVDALALGDSTAPTADLGSMELLGNEVYRAAVTDRAPSGQTLNVTLFIDATEANGLTFEEAALVAERGTGDLPINRFLIDDPGGLLNPKSRDETVTINIEITQQDA